MDKKKLAALVIASLLMVAGVVLKTDFKGMVCGPQIASEGNE